ncbi:MAG TPA: POTRA domain-containing protein [Bryobacteraceae bacterium]|nr:POTRA domain-containing protein [Bryobacteraceae bacterium]
MARICLVLLLFAAVLPAQTPGPRTVAGDFQIDSITVEGSRIPAAAIIQASGLKTGEKGNGAAFDAARDRLLATGYFDSVGYRFKASATGGYDVIFDVQEVTMYYPIRADALPASAAEITAYLKSKEPLFTGDKMPGTREVLQRTAREVEQYLESHGHPQEVAGKVVAISPEHLVIDFTPPRGLPAVAFVTFEGSKVIDAITLHNKINEVAFGQPYSEDGFRALLQSQIAPLYEMKGYMHVTFPTVTTSPSKDVTGIDVKVTIDEGPEYKLTRVAVFGKSPEESERILKRAKLPQLTVANFDEVRKAAERVQEEMRHQGFLDAEVTTDKKLDNEKKTVEFYLVATAGPEYKFGKLTVNGLGLDGEAAIKKMWGLKPGDSFPKGYGDYFLSKVKEAEIFDNLGDTKADQHVDADTHVVDVTLDFKYGAPKPKARQNPGVFGPPPI